MAEKSKLKKNQSRIDALKSILLTIDEMTRNNEPLTRETVIERAVKRARLYQSHPDLDVVEKTLDQPLCNLFSINKPRNT